MDVPVLVLVNAMVGLGPKSTGLVPGMARLCAWSSQVGLGWERRNHLGKVSLRVGKADKIRLDRKWTCTRWLGLATLRWARRPG